MRCTVDMYVQLSHNDVSVVTSQVRVHDMLYHIIDKINLWPYMQLSHNDVNVTHVVRMLHSECLIATSEGVLKNLPTLLH